jgi:sugar transferase (PEP-CTERM system associated)
MKILLVTSIWQICFYYADLYDFEVGEKLIERGTRISMALGIAAIVLSIIYYIFPDTNIDTKKFLASACLVGILMISWRLTFSVALKSDHFKRNIILIGTGQLANEIKSEIDEKKDCGYSMVLKLNESELNDFKYKYDHTRSSDQKYEGSLYRSAKKLKADKVIVAMNENGNELAMNELLKCRLNGIDIVGGDRFYEMLTGKLIVERMNPDWLVYAGGFTTSATMKVIRRMMDLVLSLVIIVLSIPVVILVAILIKSDSDGPVIYSQDRVGKRQKKFRIYKFRSMIKDAEKHSGPVITYKNDRRITKVGKYLRKWRIDETPQLWNVLKGDMSLVGPRPEREFLVDMFGSKIPHYDKRFCVKPGITGWAQVNCGYGDSLEDYIEKLNYDLFYLKNRSILLDLMILLRTIKTVLFGKGAR